MMRNRTIRALMAAASIAAVPAVLAAQQQAGAATPQTHMVVKGETLWGLSQRYLSDPYRWRDIFELNRDKINDPHWIYPGQIFAIPGTGAVTSVSVNVAPTAEVPARPAAPRVAEAPNVDPANSKTVFSRPADAVRTQSKLNLEGSAMPTVRVGEYVRAPYVVQAGPLPGRGRLIKSADLAPTGDIDSRTIFKAYDQVMMTAPAGVVARKGNRFVVLKRGDVLRGQGQILEPTGVIEVMQPPANGAAGVAQVVELYGEMSPGQILMPLDTANVSSTAKPAPVSDGRWATIKWVLESPVLPSAQSYVVLDLTAADGVRPGDEFTVYRPLTPSNVPGDPADPAIPIGRAQAIKVTPYGTTAIIVSQVQPAISVGSIVRLSAKMP